MKPCPKCKHIAPPYKKGCYACNPPNLKDFELVSISIPNTDVIYQVERQFELDLIAFVKSTPIAKDPKTGRLVARVQYATGSHGQSSRYEIRTLYDWLQSKFGAFPAGIPEMQDRHASKILLMISRMQ